MPHAAPFVARIRRVHPGALVALAAIVLAIDPVVWLVRTWRDPVYDSRGLLIFAAAPASR